MSGKKEAGEQTKDTTRASRDSDSSLPECGLIMPISATANFDEPHWRDVQELLHRGISASGFRPVNVWTNEIADRISERVVGNIFDKPLVVADISDLNPNVMFELGLRLSSKKPTVIVSGTGTKPPFDIHDFNVIFYPSDLNILGMEVFFSKLQLSLQSKMEAYSESTYVPFLSNVIVDVISPTERETTAESLILRSLEAIEERLSSLESSSRPRAWIRQRSEPRYLIELRVRNLADDQVDDLENAIDRRPTLISSVQPEPDGDNWRVIEVRNHSDTTMNAMAAELRTVISKMGLSRGDYRMRLVEPAGSES